MHTLYVHVHACTRNSHIHVFVLYVASVYCTVLWEILAGIKLVTGSQIAIERLLAGINLVVWYGITIDVHTCICTRMCMQVTNLDGFSFAVMKVLGHQFTITFSRYTVVYMYVHL